LLPESEAEFTELACASEGISAAQEYYCQPDSPNCHSRRLAEHPEHRLNEKPKETLQLKLNQPLTFSS